MYPDGTKQPHELEKLDEYVCRCGEWTDLKDCPYISEHFYGWYYSALCPKCWDLQRINNNEKARDKYHADKNRELIQTLCRVNTIKPEAASKFVQQFRRRWGGIEGLAGKMMDLVDAALRDKKASKMAALKVFELYFSMTRIALSEEHADQLIQIPKPKHKLSGVDF